MKGYIIGVYECKVDSKARLMIPVQLKKQLGAALQSSFVIKRSVFHPCLELFTIESWNDVVKDINQLNRFVKKNNDFIRMFTAGVKLTELDKTVSVSMLANDFKSRGISNLPLESRSVNFTPAVNILIKSLFFFTKRLS